MSIADKIIRAKTDYDEVYEAGKQAERDRFWDAYQQNGNRTDYYNAFSGDGWTSENLKPKYKVTPLDLYQGGVSMFYRCNWRANNPSKIIDFSKIAHMFDFSNLTDANYMFNSANIDNIIADFSSAESLDAVFGSRWGTSGLKTITIKVSEKAKLHNTFGSTITNLSFMSGSIIGQDISLSDAWYLTKESFMNVINTLSSSVSGKTATFNKYAKEVAFTDDEWAALIATKTNWTFSLV